jgi:hypothetical protein
MILLARLTHAFNPDDLTSLAAGMEQGKAVFKVPGAYEVWAGSRG